MILHGGLRRSGGRVARDAAILGVLGQQRPIGELPDITAEVAASTSKIACDRAAGMSHACQSIKASRVIQPSSEPSKGFAEPTRQ